jgi:hypothetical protein
MSLKGQVNISSSDWAPCSDGVVRDSSSSTLSLTYINFSSGHLYAHGSWEKLVKESSDYKIKVNKQTGLNNIFIIQLTFN